MDVQNAKAKLSRALTDIKANFKPDDGAVGVKKIQSMFVNLWKSGMNGKVALIASSFIVLLLLSSCLGGSSSSDESESRRLDTLVLKGLYMRQSAEDAAKVCRKIASSQGDLEAIDYHKGIEWDKNSPEFAAAVKDYEKWVETAKMEVVLRSDWNLHMENRSEMFHKGVSQEKIDKKYPNFTFDEYRKKYSKTCKPELADTKEVEKWLEHEKHFKPNKYKVAPENVIRIFAKNVEPDKKRKAVCTVWLDTEGKVKEVFFNEEGMARIFNAGDLSSEEFAQALVKNYSDIPSMDVNVTSDFESTDGTVAMKTYTWTYKDPRGFQIQILDRAYYNGGGQRIQLREDLQFQVAMSLNKTKTKWFSFKAIKPESARKFD